MNASSAIGAVVVMFSLAASSASAFVPQFKDVAASSPWFRTPISCRDMRSCLGIPARQAAARAELSKAMAQRYFDADMIVTLGALALASGAFVAAGVAGGRRRSADKAPAAPREGWREEVMQALEADLAQFTNGLRRAA